MARRPAVLAGPGTRGRLFQAQPVPPVVPSVPKLVATTFGRARWITPAPRGRMFQRPEQRHLGLRKPELSNRALWRMYRPRGLITFLPPNGQVPHNWFGNVISRARWLPTVRHSSLTVVNTRVPAPGPGHLVAGVPGHRPGLRAQPRSRIYIPLFVVVVPPPGPGVGLPSNLVSKRPKLLREAFRTRQCWPCPEYEAGIVLPQPHNVRPMYPMPRGRVRGLPPNVKNITTVPIRTFVERDQPQQLRPRRGQVWNHTYPGFVPPPPVGGPLVDRYVKQPRLRLPSPRGRIFGHTFAPTYNQPFFVPSRRPSLYKQLRSRVINYGFNNYKPPAAGPLLTLFVRPAGTRNQVLKLRRSTLSVVQNAFYQPPRPPAPRPPYPAGGSVSVSVGRRKWPQPVLFDYPKTWIWRDK